MIFLGGLSQFTIITAHVPLGDSLRRNELVSLTLMMIMPPFFGTT